MLKNGHEIDYKQTAPNPSRCELIRCLEGSSSSEEVVVAPMSGSCVGSLHSMHENEGAH